MTLHTGFLSGACFLAFTYLLGATLLAEDPIEIGTRRELFVDRALIDRMDGVELRLHHPIKAPRPNSPLPEKHMMTILRDRDLFRAYYRSSDPDYSGPFHSGHAGETVHYAESRDGHDWTFPKLGLHLVGGTRENNVILANQPPYLTNFMPFLDTRKGVDPAERYKALAGYPGPGDKRNTTEKGRGLFAFVSPDGLRWTKKAEAIPYLPKWRHAFDSPNVAFWSEVEKKYVCYFRTWIEPDRLRSISRATSLDFATWSEPIEMKPNLPGEHLYTNMTHPYFRAPHIYISLPTRYVPGRGNSPNEDPNDTNATDVLFMSTRAGAAHFDRLFTEAFIRPGLDEKQWGNRANYVAQNIHPTGPHEMSIYHRSGDRYIMRTDGFVSIQAAAREGELLTRPFVFSGEALSINASTSAAGSLRVEIQDTTGRPIPGLTLDDCLEFYGDAIDMDLKWKCKTKLSTQAGQAVRLRFVLKECDLYSFRFH